jgi:hypothetical protein
LLLLGFILAGCGGAGEPNWQRVEGGGFHFNAPSSWVVSGAAASHGAVDRVEVAHFPLLRPYERRRKAAVARELDRVAATIARQLRGRVTRRASLEVAGLDARSYVVDFAGKIEEITFVLKGRREFELLCRRRAGADDAACRELVDSFGVG